MPSITVAAVSTPFAAEVSSYDSRDDSSAEDGGAIVSEQVMMGLAPHLGRQRAHDLVYDICREAATSGKPLVDLLAADKEISKHVGRKELEQMCDPANYLGLAGEMVDRVLAIEAACR